MDSSYDGSIKYKKKKMYSLKIIPGDLGELICEGRGVFGITPLELPIKSSSASLKGTSSKRNW